jgi:hypothetical protein
MSTISTSSKIRWTLDGTNYRVLIRTKTGFLQVKSVENGVVEMDSPTQQSPYPKLKLTPFDSFDAWFASLPAVGSVVISHHKGSLNYKMMPLRGTDVEKMQALTSRFYIGEPQRKYRQHAFIIVGDAVKNIYCEKEYIEGSNHEYNYHIRIQGDETRYTRFTDIGDCLDANGKPKITVAYRGEMLPVAHIF